MEIRIIHMINAGNIFHTATKSDINADKRLYAPSTARNKEPILKVLKEYIPTSGQALEIACGSGEHGLHFSKSFPALIWQPTDIETAHIDSANAHREAENRSNMKEARYLDVTSKDWQTEPLDLIYNANMIHISPWDCTIGLLSGAGRHLKTDGILFMYGPYKFSNQHTAESNAQFDMSLKSRDDSWGIRNLEDVISIAEQNGLQHQHSIEMPANNYCIIYKKI
ncbi:DUF938 domain-containing protein [Rhodospirillaceae bacterium RKSG073]|nr:DUF938 domain-containing protein [Curvivirga aplysinae]